MFQSYKTLDPEERKKFCNMTGGQAKRYGKKVKLRSDWEDVKFLVMRYCVIQKFFQNPDIARKLRETSGQNLIEGNNWHDKYWGAVLTPIGDTDCWVGENRLGLILRQVRSMCNDVVSTPYPEVYIKQYVPMCTCQEYVDTINRNCERFCAEYQKEKQSKEHELKRINDAIDVAWKYGGIDGDHHRAWVIDQMLQKMMTPDEYKNFVKEYENDGEYEWYKGIAP